MTIDEAITHAREIAERNRILADSDELVQKSYDVNFEMKKCVKCAEEHEQLAEWLEDYKRLLEVEKSVLANEDGYLATLCERKGYNKAIYDFAEKLNEKCEGMIKDKWNSNSAPISWAEAYADFKDDIAEIAEQLKAGGENE